MVTEERLTDIEMRYMLQERTIQELSDTVYQQEQELARLALEVRQLREQLLIVQPSITRDPDDEEPPPHY
jgi:uncharacterized coiled-coil protein SlyX